MKKTTGKILAVLLTAALFLGFLSGCSKKEEQKEEADFIANKTWYIGEVELTFSDTGKVEYLIPSTGETGTMDYEWDNKTMSGRLLVQDWTLDMKKAGDKIELMDGSGSQGFLTREKEVQTPQKAEEEKILYYGQKEVRFAPDGSFTAAQASGTYTWDEAAGTGVLIANGKNVDLKKEGSRIILTVDGEEKGILTDKIRVYDPSVKLEGQTWYYGEIRCNFKKDGVFEVEGKKGTYTWNKELGTGTITLNNNTVVMFMMDDVLELEDRDGSQGMLTELPMINSGK